MPRQARLIIAEDERIVALGMELYLSEKGHEVCAIARTGPEAVRLAEAHRPDLVLMDVRLADGTDGLAAAAEIERRFGIPAIIVTGHLPDELVRRAGALGLLRKPFTPVLLGQAIENALRRLEQGEVFGRNAGPANENGGHGT